MLMNGEWIKKIRCVCVCVCVCVWVCVCVCEILLSSKKNEILYFVTMWMDLQSIILSEINQAEKDKYYTISLICRIWKNKPNEQTEQNRNSGTENKQMVARGERVREKRNKWGKLRGTNFPLWNKWVTDIKYTMWRIIIISL